MGKKWLSLALAIMLALGPSAGAAAEAPLPGLETAGQLRLYGGEKQVTVQSEEADGSMSTSRILSEAPGNGASAADSYEAVPEGDFTEELYGENSEVNSPEELYGESSEVNSPEGLYGEVSDLTFPEDMSGAESGGISPEDMSGAESAGDSPEDMSKAESAGDSAEDMSGAESAGDSPEDMSGAEPGGTSPEDLPEAAPGGDGAAGEDEALDEITAEGGALQEYDAGDFLIEDIQEVEAQETGEYEADEADDLTEEIEGTLQRNGYASDAMLRQYGTYGYSPGTFLGSYGAQLTGQTRDIYLKMKAAYVDQRTTGDLEITLNSALSFWTTGTVSGGKLNWDRTTNAEYQEICLTIEYMLQSSFDALVYDYPEVFWMGVPDYTYWINYSYYGGEYKGTITEMTFMPTSVEAYSGASSEIKAFDAAVAQAKNSITAGSTREETVRAIHDYLCGRIVYRENTYAHSAGGVFLHASGSYNYVVCEGYAKAFKILCGKFGIPCILVVGDADGAHMWNYVQMEDGNWYLVDVTWDDNPFGDPVYDYFLKGSNTPSAVDSSLDIGHERVLYTNFSRSEYTENFNYPYLSAEAYTGGQHEHLWQVIARKDPTCTAEGYSVYRCSCGAISYEAVDATGHSYREKKYIYNNDATCLRDGTKTAVCDNGCGTKRQTVYAAGTKLKSTISFSAPSVKLKTKQSTSKFRVTYGKGDYVVSWKSGNKKIVKVTGKADGTCTIKAQNKAGSAKITVTLASGRKGSFTVKVQKTAVKTTKISGISKKLSLSRGETYSLQPSISPFTSKQKVTYKSSDKKVASVSKKGVIKAKKKGKTTITVQSGSKKVKCKVTVK